MEREQFDSPSAPPKRNDVDVDICPYKDLYTEVCCSFICSCPYVETPHVSLHGLMNELWYIHTMECYSSVNRNEPQTPAAAWVNFRFIIPSEKSQAEYIKYEFIYMNV